MGLIYQFGILTMLKHYLKIALRNLFKQKGISLINIFGLTVGMTCAILIFLWVGQQLSYDQAQIKKDRIFRLESQNWVIMPPYLRETVRAFPEVETSSRFFFWWEPRVKYQDKVFTVKDLALCDSTTFNIFNFDFIAGDEKRVFEAPYSIVLTESISKKLFGTENPILL
jgi:putative ABC transport system permease protein